MNKKSIVLLSVFLAGCQSAAEVQSSIDRSAPASGAVKAAIVNDARDFLADPYSIRDAEISYLQLNERSGLQWLCVKANARNMMGGYTGRQVLEVWVKNERLVGNVPHSPACNNPALKWLPFPELEALRDI